MDPHSWLKEISKVQEAYPDATFQHRSCTGKLSGILRLTINPSPDTKDLNSVLADLDRGNAVSISTCGKIAHSLNCSIPLNDHPVILPRLRLLKTAYSVEIWIQYSHDGTQWPIHPKAYIVHPEISLRKYSYHPHLSGDVNCSWACPISPQDNTWRWEPGSLLKYLDQLAIWILKTEIWVQTGGSASLGRWIGPATSHDPLDCIGSITLGNPCRCGSGKCYSDCHYSQDFNMALLESTRKHPHSP